MVKLALDTTIQLQLRFPATPNMFFGSAGVLNLINLSLRLPGEYQKKL